MRRRSRFTLLLLLSGALLSFTAGCGGGSGSDSGQISDAITKYLSAIASGDGKEACDQLTIAEAEKVFEEATELLPELRATGCASALSRLSESIGGEREALESAEPTNIRINGSSATAGVVGGTKTVELEELHGSWLISGGLGLGG